MEIMLVLALVALLYSVIRYQAMEAKWLEAEYKLIQLQAALRKAKPSE